MKTSQHTERKLRTPATIAVAAALAVAALLPLARAADGKPAATTTAATPATVAPRPAAATATTDDAAKAVLRYSQAGQDAIDDVRFARLDLFDGNTGLAMKDMRAAQKSLTIAKAEAPSFATSTQVKVQGKVVGVDKDRFTADLVPVDGDLVLADHMLQPPRHESLLARARKYLSKGDKAGAIDTLRQSDVAVTYQRRWIPLADSAKRLDQAISLASQHKYYEANLALKEIEDHMLTDTVDVDLSAAAKSAS